MRNISQELESHDLHTDPVGLFDFHKLEFEQREEAKFISQETYLIILICKIGEKHDISRDLAFCDVGIFKELHISIRSRVAQQEH